jgi:hypothetical protein
MSKAEPDEIVRHRKPSHAAVVTRKDYDMHPLGLRFKQGKLPFDTWSNIGGTLEAMERGIQWWIGDWMVYGEKYYGDDHVQAVDATGFQLETIMQHRWVCERVPFERRRLALSYSHHREVADLTPAQQTKWLDKAEAEDWSVDRLRRELGHEKKKAAAEEGADLHVWVLVEAKDPADAETLISRFKLEGRKAKLSGK